MYVYMCPPSKYCHGLIKRLVDQDTLSTVLHIAGTSETAIDQ